MVDRTPGGPYINTVGRHGNEETIRPYVAAPGHPPEYRQLHFQPCEQSPALLASVVRLSKAPQVGPSDAPQLVAGEILFTLLPLPQWQEISVVAVNSHASTLMTSPRSS